MKKQAWTAILLWMALFSFTLSAQGTGGTTTDLTVTKNSDPPENINGSCIINSSGTYRFTGTYSGTPTAEIGSSEGKAVISVAAGIAGEVTIILENVTITLTGNQQCPLSARNATGTVIVQLKGSNTLTSGAQCPALWAPQTSEGKLIINSSGTRSEVGSLTATGGNKAAGIGGGYGGAGGTIKITGGTVEATGSDGGAGIGGGYGGAGGTITISGGKVTAKGGTENTSDGAAGIGGGYYGNGGKITISGGTTNVTATGVNGGAGIGGGFWGDGGKITISGGTVTAMGGNWVTRDGAAGIGGGYLGAGGTITIKGGTVTATGGHDGAAGIGYGKNYTGTDGTITITGGEVTATNGSETATNTPDIKGYTVIVGPGATVKKGITGTLEYNDYTNGFVLSNNATEVTMKGTATLLADITIGTDQTLIIPTDASLTIEEKVTLENKGTITNNGTIYKRGTIDGTISPENSKIINQTKLIESMITIDPATYDGSTLTPNVTVSYSDITYTKGTHYTVEYENNKDAGTATVKVTPTDKDHGTLYGEAVTKEFTIQRKSLSFTFSGLENLTYDGQEHGAAVSSITGLVADETVTPALAYQKKEGENGEFTNIEGLPKNAGNYKVIVKSVDNTNYTVDKENNSADFTIQKATPLYVVPTGLTAICGQTLADVTLPNGWAWMDKTTSVGDDIATKNFPAQYTPEDTDNYNEVASVEVSITVTQAEANLSFAQPTLTITLGDAVPANELTNTHTCPVTYSSSNEAVAKVEAATGAVTVVGVGTTTIKATAGGNYTGSASYTLTVNSYIPPYIPPTPDPDPDPVYYTVTIPSEVAGAIIHGGGTHEVEEYTYCSFRIELDPNGNGEYPTVTKGYWWDTLTPDGQGNYSVYVTGNTQITIGEVPTNSYDYYQVTLPTDSVAEADDQYWSGDYIEVTGASPLRAAEEASLSYQAPFGMTVSLRPIETERRKFLQWEDGSKQKERTLTLRADQEIKALWQRISPTGIEAIAAGSVLRGERGQLYIEVPEPCDVTLYTYGGVPVRVARLAAGANRLANLNAGLYLVKLGAAPAVPVRVR
ncbi:Ig-like domain-containing protein [Parabacteroides distasonis]|nr:Ig-like domain-containing protein [Parabacteroides distasonis]